MEFPDWRVSPNIVGAPQVYELENEALLRDGRLDAALWEIAPWRSSVVVDIGAGTGFWLPTYAEAASEVIGIEPDPKLLAVAIDRVESYSNIRVVRGSAERVPLDDGVADVVHARFAYFFGEGADAGLAEVERVLKPGGSLVVVDNSWAGGDFAELLRASNQGNALIDPAAVDAWWAQRGAERIDVQGGWVARSAGELEQILRIEFSAEVVDDFIAHHQSPRLSYHFAVFHWRPQE